MTLGLSFSASALATVRHAAGTRESEYAYAGQLLLLGIAPYQLAYSMKLPGPHLAYAAIMAVLGETSSGIHLGLLAIPQEEISNANGPPRC